MPNFLYCIGKAVADVGVAELAVVATDPNLVGAANVIAKIAANAWKEWRAEKKQNKLNADVLAAAKLNFEQAKQEAVEIAKQVSSDPEVRAHVERFVTLVPACVRASLRRPEDPSGTTLPAQYKLTDAEDLIALLPARFPRFKAGDAPPFLKGWRLEEQIGAGGFGEVWKARHTRASNLLRAVKFGHGLDEAEQSLLNEGDVLNRLLADGQPDGVVKLLDMWADNDPLPWLQYEYIPGGDLTGLIHRWQWVSVTDRVDRATDALAQLSATVGHFHTLHPFVVHRDLKPSNILVAADGRLKVADFGIGAVSSKRILSSTGGKLSSGGVLASYLRGSHTPLYASPQQRAGSRELDPRDDVHALGVIAFQMLTGQLDAAPGSDVEHDLAACGTPARLIDLIRNCTARDPARRPGNAAELHRQVQAVLRQPIARVTPTPPPPPVARPAPAPVPLSVAPPIPRGRLVREENPRPTPAPRRAEKAEPPVAGPKPSRRGCLGAILFLGGGAVAAGWWWWPNLRHLAPWGNPDKLPDRNMTGNRKAGDVYTLSFGSQFSMTFAWCPPGTFGMGGREKEAADDERPLRTVTLSQGFYCGVHEVTQKQWLAVMGSEPSERKGENLPVDRVSWADAAKFCTKLSERTGNKLKLRLPTEAEWEYACRAGTTTAYHVGEGANSLQMNAGGGGPKDVGGFLPNPWGLFDMHGNVQEWCEDVYDSRFYTDGPLVDPVCREAKWRTDPNQPPPLGGPATLRVARGGRWGDTVATCRSGKRAGLTPTATLGVGFRVVFTQDGGTVFPPPAPMPAPPG